MKIERGTKKYLFTLMLYVSILGMILYPLFDLIYYNFIVNSTFTYSIEKHIIQPVIFSVVYSLVFWIIDKKRK